ncbi:MAG: site-specific DNA-methyltransferase [Tissierellia bacterium]|nr:site-specific DNA-methyltransferase [Tissierellia bacterium]
MQSVDIFPETNSIYYGDNKKLLSAMIKRTVNPKFIYLDPPFFTKKDRAGKVALSYEGSKINLTIPAYEDCWEGLFDYLLNIGITLYLCREVLNSKGVLCLHVDFRTVHYFRIIFR